jgi:hypothetical protein
MNAQQRINRWRGTPLRRLVLSCALMMIAIGSAFLITPRKVDAGDHRKICWGKVYLRNYPQGRAWSQLYKGQTFEVYEYRSSGWARGRAGSPVSTDKSPYQKPYNDVWIEVAAFCPR